MTICFLSFTLDHLLSPFLPFRLFLLWILCLSPSHLSLSRLLLFLTTLSWTQAALTIFSVIALFSGLTMLLGLLRLKLLTVVSFLRLLVVLFVSGWSRVNEVLFLFSTTACMRRMPLSI